MAANGRLLVCYDGSDGAKAALEAAARAFAGHDAVIACYWQPFGSSPKRFAVDIRELVQDADDVNRREKQLAQRIADEGAGLARSFGLGAADAPSRSTARSRRRSSPTPTRSRRPRSCSERGAARACARF